MLLSFGYAFVLFSPGRPIFIFNDCTKSHLSHNDM